MLLGVVIIMCQVFSSHVRCSSVLKLFSSGWPGKARHSVPGLAQCFLGQFFADDGDCDFFHRWVFVVCHPFARFERGFTSTCVDCHLKL